MKERKRVVAFASFRTPKTADNLRRAFRLILLQPGEVCRLIESLCKISGFDVVSDDSDSCAWIQSERIGTERTALSILTVPSCGKLPIN